MKENQLRVWWSSQIPITEESKEEYLVENVEEAKKKIIELTNRDLKIESIIDNVGGLEIFEKNHEGKLEWSEYYDEEGNDIDEILEGVD